MIAQTRALTTLLHNLLAKSPCGTSKFNSLPDSPSCQLRGFLYCSAQVMYRFLLGEVLKSPEAPDE